MQDRRMQWVVQIGHLLIGTVNGQGVLDQVVGADGQKVKVRQKHGHGQCGGWDLNHRADLERTIGHALRIELRASARQQSQGLANFFAVGQHGNEQIHLAMRRRSQNRPQLGQEHGRVGQAPTDGAQSQSRIEVGGFTHIAVQRFIGTNVDGANGHR